MTFLEKLKQEHALACPFQYGFEQRADMPCSNPSVSDCAICWNREIPGTFPTTKSEPMSDGGAGEADGMTAEREAHILEAAIKHFGSAAQVDMMIEEMSELTKALLKWRRAAMIDGDNTEEKYNAILEEMADVQIMLNQMALIFGDPVEHEITKLERLEKRIADHA